MLVPTPARRSFTSTGTCLVVGRWAGRLAEPAGTSMSVSIDLEGEERLSAAVEAGVVRRAVAAAVLLGTTEPHRPLPVGLQPVLSMSLVFTDDARIQQLNRDYRGVDQPTDVLSFSQIEEDGVFVPAPTGRLELGDVIVS